jgi:type II secretory pathway component PulM
MSLKLLLGLGGASAIAITVLWLGWSAAAAERDAARAALQVAIEANKSLDAANKRLAEQNAIDGRVVLGLSQELAAINAALAAAGIDLAELERNDDAVRQYLDTPVPDALRMQLER